MTQQVKKENMIIPSWLPIIHLAIDRLRVHYGVPAEDITVVVLEELRNLVAGLEPMTDDYGTLHITVGDTDENSFRDK